MSKEKNTALISALNECAAACNHCTTACLNEQEVKMLTKCIRLEIDCAEICRLAAAFSERGSQHAEHLLIACAEICEACAAECEKHEYMEHCRHCAEACRKCAEACMASNLTNAVA